MELTLKIGAMMSLPRLGFNATWGCVLDALIPFQIPLTRYTGAFWEQQAQNGLADFVRNGTDWVLLLDYDSVFTPKQLDVLLGHFGNNPHIDALAALEPKRDEGCPLMTIRGQTGVEVTGDPVKVDTAHFGLTLIRTEALAAIPMPWMHGQPGAGGAWGDDRVDPDIFFWRKWAEYGKTVYVAPDVRIGHIEEVVSYFDDGLNLVRESYKEWRRKQA